MPNLDIAAVSPMIVVAIGAVLMPLIQVLLARKKTLLGRPLTSVSRGTYLSALSTIVLILACFMTLSVAQSGTSVFNADHPFLLFRQ